MLALRILPWVTAHFRITLQASKTLLLEHLHFVLTSQVTTTMPSVLMRSVTANMPIITMDSVTKLSTVIPLVAITRPSAVMLLVLFLLVRMTQP